MGRGRTENRYFKQRYSGELSASHKQDKATSCQREETENRHLGAFTAVHGFADFWGNSWHICFQRLFQRLYPFFLGSVTAVVPICGISEAFDYFQSRAVFSLSFQIVDGSLPQ